MKTVHLSEFKLAKSKEDLKESDYTVTLYWEDFDPILDRKYTLPEHINQLFTLNDKKYVLKFAMGMWYNVLNYTKSLSKIKELPQHKLMKNSAVIFADITDEKMDFTAFPTFEYFFSNCDCYYYSEKVLWEMNYNIFQNFLNRHKEQIKESTTICRKG